MAANSNAANAYPAPVPVYGAGVAGGPVFMTPPAQKSGSHTARWIIIGVVATIITLLLLVIIAIGLIGFLGTSTKTEGVVHPTDAVAAPPSGWIAYNDPSGRFRANLPAQPTVTNVPPEQMYISRGSNFATTIGVADRHGLPAAAAIELSKQGLVSSGQVMSDTKGEFNGGTSEDVIFFQKDVNVYEEARIFASQNHIYILVAAAQDQDQVGLPFDELVNGFTTANAG
jgi:hypothetical protein